MKARTQILVAAVVALSLAALTASLLVSEHARVAVWLYGPYLPLSRLPPRSVDTLPTLVVVVAAYSFAASLLVLRFFSFRTLLLVVAGVVALSSVGYYVLFWVPD